LGLVCVLEGDMTTRAEVDGLVAPGFEEVRVEFERNFTERGDIGAAVAAYWRGDKVVDLWGGRRTPQGDEPWNGTRWSPSCPPPRASPR
jgi:hypothetical protein